jgi:predicted permease
MEMNSFDGESSATFFETIMPRLAARPEVEAVGRASRLPLSLNNNGFGLYIDGRQESADDPPFIIDGASVDEGYFDALDLALVRGRGIQLTDRAENLRVAVVTAAMADLYWPGEDPLGREFRREWGGEPYQIVGVVEDYKVDTPGEAPKPYIHLPLSTRSTYANFIIRTSTPAAQHVLGFEREFRELDPELVFLETGTFRRLAAVRLFPILAGAWLVGAFGLLALLLAAVGLYGVIGYSVSRRVREISIRKALGAESGTVVGMVLRQGMVLVAIGGVVGAALAGVAARLMSSVLFVDTFDPVSFLSAFVILAAIAALANWLPARRAARVEPMGTLRSH